jgi:hypothetical protein
MGALTSVDFSCGKVEQGLEFGRKSAEYGRAGRRFVYVEKTCEIRYLMAIGTKNILPDVPIQIFRH